MMRERQGEMQRPAQQSMRSGGMRPPPVPARQQQRPPQQPQQQQRRGNKKPKPPKGRAPVPPVPQAVTEAMYAVTPNASAPPRAASSVPASVHPVAVLLSKSLRTQIIINEVLQPPLALREPRDA
jgi:hypothetical protein